MAGGGLDGDVVDVESSIAEHRSRFQERYGRAPGVRLFFAPGRVNLLGAHLDYNGGPVGPMAIDRGTFIAARPRADGHIRLASTLESETFEAELSAYPAAPTRTWVDYPLGVLRFLSRDAPHVGGVDALFGGNLAIGAGLSSSASICVGTAVACNGIWDLDCGVERLIEAALWAEREFVGVKCGIMDPFAVAMTRPDHLLWLDCKDETVDHLPLDSSAVSVAVADSLVRRELAHGAFNERVDECRRVFEHLAPLVPGASCLRDVPLAVVEREEERLGPVLLARARHVAGEVARTFSARAALRDGDLAGFGDAMSASHASLRDLYEVSIPELDVLVETSLAWPGVLGARLTGAGFGGCVVIALRSEARAGFRRHLTMSYESRFGRVPRVSFFRGDGGPREIGL